MSRYTSSRAGLLASALLVAVALTSSPRAADEVTEQTAARAVIDAYRAALASRDVAPMEQLFADSAIVLENGKPEGTWREYADHHLKPEFASLTGVELGPSHLELSVVESWAWAVDHFDFTITTPDSNSVKLQAAVTYVLRRLGSEWRVAHLHWSSRRVRTPADTPSPGAR